MNKDMGLKKEDLKIIFLICGNPKVGKKYIVKKWTKNLKITENEFSYYNSYSLIYPVKMTEHEILKVPLEFRILNSKELNSDLKMIKNFYEGALGSFIITEYGDEASFNDAIKWKEKIDLMCCLPNHFPLPIFLIINKANNNYLNEKEKYDDYSLENQFFRYFWIIKEGEKLEDKDDNNKLGNNIIKQDNEEIINKEDENIKDNIINEEPNLKEIDSNKNKDNNKKNENNELETNLHKEFYSEPFQEMINIILNFKDLRDKFLKNSSNIKNKDINNPELKKKCNIY